MPVPDYHFLYIEPSLGADWLFIAARRYWEKFRPMVIYDLDLVSYVYPPGKKTVVVTSLARRDLAPKVAEEIKKKFPKVQFDPLVYDFVSEMKLTLDGRADYDQRFGVPEAPNPTIIPTLGPVVGS